MYCFMRCFKHFFNQFGSVTQSYPTLCNPIDCSTPGLPVHHQLPESTQTHVHCHLYIISLVTTLIFCQCELYIHPTQLSTPAGTFATAIPHTDFSETHSLLLSGPLPRLQKSTHLPCVISAIVCLESQKLMPAALPTTTCPIPEVFILKNCTYLFFSHFSISPP